MNVFKTPVADYHAMIECLCGLKNYSKKSLSTPTKSLRGVFIVLPRCNNCADGKTMATMVKTMATKVMYIMVVNVDLARSVAGTTPGLESTS
ncbi:hypothetical protein [Devosia sp. Root105]|uniref:hypothetical protein n=1 Tax=Devosia sp. Root105 TaxID=1736423 RepID=UPI0012E358EA|nr:hypothetical protein [Devosia sp. Root105]